MTFFGNLCTGKVCVYSDEVLFCVTKKKMVLMAFKYRSFTAFTNFIMMEIPDSMTSFNNFLGTRHLRMP